MSIKVGCAPDSWGVWFASDSKQTPWNRYLDEVSQAGYAWTELGPYGYLPPELETLRTELGRRNLKVTGIACMVHLEDSEAWPGLEKQLIGGGELVARLAGRFVVLIDDTYSDLFTGKLTRPKQLDDAAWKRLIDTTHRAADLVDPDTICNWSIIRMPKRTLNMKSRSSVFSTTPTRRRVACASTPAITPTVAVIRWSFSANTIGGFRTYTSRASTPKSKPGWLGIKSLSPSRWPTTCFASRRKVPSISRPFAMPCSKSATTVLPRLNRTCIQRPSTNHFPSLSAPASI